MKTSLFGALLGVASLASAQVARYCSSEEKSLCYSVNVPDTSASSGSGDIYFQIKGPDSLQWIALGQGQQMAGSNMFVIYTDTTGKNLTLSPRSGTGHVMPRYNSDAQVTLLEGSGVSDGMMTANVRCGNCDSWSGGKMSFTSSSSNWIYAYKSGDSLDSNSNSASIDQHDDKGAFTLDLATAKGGSSSNPFVAQAGTAAGTSTAPASPTGTGNVGASGASGESGEGAGGESEGGGMMSNIPMYQKSHGTIMGIAFVILFPAGVFVRAFAPRTSIWVHAGVQSLAWVLALVGMGLGIYLAKKLMELDTTHAIIGLVVVSVMAFQPIGGLLQHMHFKKNGTRGIFGWGHRLMGMALILLGLINGGLGLELAENSRSGEIAYGVLAGLVGIAMLGAFAMSTFKKSGPTNVDKHAGNGYGKEESRHGI